MKRIGSFIVMVAAVFVTACGKDITAPVSVPKVLTQIVGPCWVSKDLVGNDGKGYTISAHYQNCPSVTVVDSLGEYETVNHP